MRNEGGGARIGERRLMIPLRKSTFIPVNPYVHRSAGPQEEGALMCSKGTNLGPAQQSSAGLLHFERWQGNWIHREPQATENPVTRFPSGGSMHNDSIGKNRYSYDESRNLSREALIKSLSDFILGFLCNARNNPTRIASYLRRIMTKQCTKILMKSDSAN